MTARTQKRERWLFLLALLVFTLAGIATYRSVIWGNRMDLCGGYDVYRAAGPLSYYMDYCLHERGEVPLWNPLTLCGMPYAANPVSAFYYPGNWARALLSFQPTPKKTQIGWALMEGLHLLLAGLGLYALGRRQGLRFAASLAVGLLFMFSAIWIRRVCEYHFINMMAWLPWLLVIAHYAMDADTLRAKVRLGCLGGILLGISLLAGTMNIAPYLGCFLGAFVVFRRLLKLGEANWLRRARGDVFFLLLVFCIGAGISLALVLPVGELAALSGRSNDAGQQLADPAYRGTARTLLQDLVRFPGVKWAVEDIRGAGVGALLLVLAALSHRHWRRTALYVLLFLVFFDLSMGAPWPVSTVFYACSPFQMIASTRAFDFAVIALAMLAGIGVDALHARPRRVLTRLLLSIVLLVAGAGCWHVLRPLVGPETFLAPGMEVVYLPMAALGAMLALLWLPRWRAINSSGALAVDPSPAGKPPVAPVAGTDRWSGVSGTMALTLVALLFAETLVWNGRYVPHITTKKNFQRWAGVYAGADALWQDNLRGVDHVQNRHLYALRPAMHGYEPIHIRAVRNVLSGGSRERRYERSVKDWEVTRENHRGNLFLKRSFWLARQYVDGPLRGKHSLFPAATTVYLRGAGPLDVPCVDDADVPQLAVSDEATRVEVVTPEQLEAMRAHLENPGARRILRFPRVTLDGRHRALCLRFQNAARVECRSVFREVGGNGLWQDGKTARLGPHTQHPVTLQLPLPDFGELRAEVTFESSGSPGKIVLEDAWLLVDEADEGHRIEILDRGANHVSVKLHDVPGPRILTFLDAYYPGWHATLDGAPVPILRANDAFKAVAIPAGTHEVRFTYRPTRVYLGAAIAAAVLLAALAGLWLTRTPVLP